MIEIEEFKKRYQVFEKIDSNNDPHTFQKFWKYKLEKENKDNHILDESNRKVTLSKLEPILKIWKWHRPYEFDYCFKIVKNSVKDFSESYNSIRNFNLTQFDKVPQKNLKIIWDTLGSIKQSHSGELVMKITKPLMFLWGQTPAFDSIVRTRMPLFNFTGFSNTRWDFKLWINVMKALQKYLNNHAELISAFKEMSKKKYGQDEILPYGQFLDLYYWTEDNLNNNKIRTTRRLDQQNLVGLEKKAKQQEYQKLTYLLNKLRSNGKIPAEERRDFAERWRHYPNLRNSIMQQLELMLNQKSN